MKRDGTVWQFVGFIGVSLGGTLLHFLYDWSGESVLMAPFSGVNESTWEHMKLLFFPLFLFALIQRHFFKECEEFWCIKLVGTVAGLVTIPMLFYTYNGMFGRSPDWINISIFFVAVAVSFWLEAQLLKKDCIDCKRPYLAFAVICLIGVLFVIFTFAPPQLPLFQDPLTGTYGI